MFRSPTKLFILAFAAFLLAGCVGDLFAVPMVITVSPDPVEVTFNDLTQPLDLIVRFSIQGTGLLQFGDIDFELYPADDEDADPIDLGTYSLEEFFPAFPAVFPVDVSVNFPESFQYETEAEYNEVLKGQDYTLVLWVDCGTSYKKAEALIQFR